MHFLSFEWLAWLCGTVAAYWLIPARWRRYSLVVITLSFLSIHALKSAACLSLFAILAYYSGSRQGPSFGYRIAAAALTIVGILIYYKVSVDVASGDQLQEVLIPLGLSYYSFRCIHYLFERYRGTLPKHSFGDFLSYLFFIPTIVVGPIHRFGPFWRDLYQQRWSSTMLSEGMERILYGYVKIAVLGNYLVSEKMGQFIGDLDPARAPLISYLEIVRGGLNLYLQFSGFADVAIGFALLLGYRVIENFDWPYLRKNIAELWRCWHISLTSWCRDYIYFPMLGLTRNPYLATISSFVVIGLWHEISLRYLVWALYNASCVLIWQQLQRFKRKLKVPRVKNRYGRWVLDGLSIILTVHVFWFGIAMVREPDLSAALRMSRTVLFFWI